MLPFIPREPAPLSPRPAVDKHSRDAGVHAGHQLHLGEQPGPVGLLREVHNDVLPVGAEGWGHRHCLGAGSRRTHT